jgi:hypothetical protein
VLPRIGHRYLRLVSRNYKACLPVRQVHDQHRQRMKQHEATTERRACPASAGSVGAGSYRNCFVWLIALMAISCSNHVAVEQRFVSTKDREDTLVLFENGKYRRVCTATDTGTWYFDDGHVWFSYWINRGESNSEIEPTSEGMVGFSADKGMLGGIEKVYFDVDDYYFYDKIP